MNIQAKNYLATDAEVSTLTRDMIAAQAGLTGGRTTYLRVLAAHTIAELDAKPRKHAGKAPALKDDGISEQLTALQAVHDRLYACVLEAASENLPAKDKPLELNRRTNFARTSLSAIRSYIRAGHDITYVVLGKLSKGFLEVPRVKRMASPKVLRARVEARSKAFMASALELSERDKPAAIGELELIIGQLAAQLAALGVAVVKDVKKAKAGALLNIRGKTFVPVTETQVIAQRARPS
jgi:hypothetical protein